MSQKINELELPSDTEWIITYDRDTSTYSLIAPTADVIGSDWTLTTFTSERTLAEITSTILATQES